MHVEAWDTVFVRARRRDVHPLVADLARWPDWWPGVAVRPVRGGIAVTVRPPRAHRWPWPGSAQRFTARLTRERPDLGIDLHYDGDLCGSAEFYYLDEPAGTLVHYLLRAQVPDRRWRRRLADHRAVARAGLQALKTRLEGARPPGDEPDPELLADQRRAIAQFRARVAAGKRASRGSAGEQASRGSAGEPASRGSAGERASPAGRP